MKRILLLSFAIALAGLQLRAQVCTPDPNVPDDAPIFPEPYDPDNPDPNDGITDTACINEFFDFTQTVNLPPDFSGLPIDSLVIPENGVTNLPAGVGYDCEPPSCTFLPDVLGCIYLNGTPTETGVFDLEVLVKIHITGQPDPIDFTFPNFQFPGNFFLHVRPEGDPNCETSSTSELAREISFTAQPNPTSGYALLQVESLRSGEYQLLLTDLLGRAVLQRKVQLLEGANTIELAGGHLPAGMYQVSISDGRSAVSQKLIIAKR